MPGVVSLHASRGVMVDEVDRWLNAQTEQRAVSFYNYFPPGMVRCCVKTKSGDVEIEAWATGPTSREAMSLAIGKLVKTFADGGNK